MCVVDGGLSRGSLREVETLSGPLSSRVWPRPHLSPVSFILVFVSLSSSFSFTVTQRPGVPSGTGVNLSRILKVWQDQLLLGSLWNYKLKKEQH